LKVAQIIGHIPGGRVSFGSPLGQRPEANPFEFPRDRIVDLPGRARLIAGDPIEQLLDRLRLEWPPPREQLIQDNSETKDVRAAVDTVAFAPGLLGAHVGWCPGMPRPTAKIPVAQCQPKIADERPPRNVQQDVAGLDISVYQPTSMRMVEGVGDGRHHVDDLGHRRTRTLEPVP
jgi:hypothetical protein